MDVLFEIPVYRVSPDDWLEEVERFAAKARAAYLRQVPVGQEPNPRSVEHFERMLLASNGYNVPYEYNQVVGWVRVEWDGPGPFIKAYAYKIPQKSVRRSSSITRNTTKFGAPGRNRTCDTRFRKRRWNAPLRPCAASIRILSTGALLCHCPVQ